MEKYRNKRILYSPRAIKAVERISDLLYFDYVTAPIIDHSFSVMADFTQDEKKWMLGPLQKLFEKGLMVPLTNFINEDFLRAAFFASGFEPSMIDIINKVLINSEIPLETEIQSINSLHDKFESAVIGSLMLIAKTEKFHIIKQIEAGHGSKKLNSGNSEVLSILFDFLPSLDMDNLNYDYLIDFLQDEESQKKKRRLFSWQNEMEKSIEKGNLNIEHLADLIATNIDDYRAWMEKSQLKLRYEKREVFYYLASSFLTVIKLPNAFEKYFEFKKRRIDLIDDEKAPGRELAYIVHATERLRE